MRKIRKTRMDDKPVPLSELQIPFPSPPAVGMLASDSGNGRARIAAEEPDERVHYLGAVVHAAPLILETVEVVEAVPIKPAKPVWREPYPAAARLRAREVVVSNTLLACGMGLMFVPLVDLTGGAIAIGRMLKTLSDLYGYQKTTWSRSAIVALLATMGAMGGGRIAAGLLLRLAPFGGGMLAAAALPASLGCVTYALGMAAIRHFESGKTATPPSLAALLAGARKGRKEAEMKVSSILGRGEVRLKA